ncbi:rCG33494 [Rattus norvegicus]|uniref:RCG33494 n=1 Tax=Rattus norvegicus TaxID=10116 RepID=A6HCJ3_RAT|nr:rCG33494 [Rattus norvegicus]
MNCAKPAWRSAARSGAGSVYRTNNLATSPASPLHILSSMQQWAWELR